MEVVNSGIKRYEDYKVQMERCIRCSSCKFVPMSQVRSWRFCQGCPSARYYNFHAYSASGRVITAYGLANEILDYSDELVETIYTCQMDGLCDVSCKTCMAGIFEPLEIMQALRIKLVEDSQFLPQHVPIIESLKAEDNTMQRSKKDRGNWAEGLDLKDLNKEKADVGFHAGCRYSFDEDLWPTVRGAISLIKSAGVDVGIFGKEEACCGCRAYEMGYLGELTKYAEHNKERYEKAGIKTLVTPCAEGYQAFKVLYPKIGQKLDFEVLHVTQYLDRLIREGKLKLNKEIPMTVTYHDPCHLGRLADPYEEWKGTEKKVLGQLIVTEPQKPIRYGTKGVYEEPRRILRSIPGIRFSEMERIKEYAWCCGAGGGVLDTYPDFASSTALARIEEAKTIAGAEALVSACPWCTRNFKDAIKETKDKIKVYDIIDLVLMAI
jgi:Fe-S oxidoreductase